MGDGWTSVAVAGVGSGGGKGDGGPGGVSGGDTWWWRRRKRWRPWQWRRHVAATAGHRHQNRREERTSGAGRRRTVSYHRRTTSPPVQPQRSGGAARRRRDASAHRTSPYACSGAPAWVVSRWAAVSGRAGEETFAATRGEHGRVWGVGARSIELHGTRSCVHVGGGRRRGFAESVCEGRVGVANGRDDSPRDASSASTTGRSDTIVA